MMIFTQYDAQYFYPKVSNKNLENLVNLKLFNFLAHSHTLGLTWSIIVQLQYM